MLFSISAERPDPDHFPEFQRGHLPRRRGLSEGAEAGQAIHRRGSVHTQVFGMWQGSHGSSGGHTARQEHGTCQV